MDRIIERGQITTKDLKMYQAMEAEIAELKERLSIREGNIQMIKVVAQTIQDKLSRRNKQIADLSNRLNSLKKMELTCPNCETTTYYWSRKDGLYSSQNN